MKHWRRHIEMRQKNLIPSWGEATQLVWGGSPGSPGSTHPGLDLPSTNNVGSYQSYQICGPFLQCFSCMVCMVLAQYWNYACHEAPKYEDWLDLSSLSSPWPWEISGISWAVHQRSLGVLVLSSKLYPGWSLAINKKVIPLGCLRSFQLEVAEVTPHGSP